MACHLFGVPSHAEHSRLEVSGNDRFALNRQFVQYRPEPCHDGRFSDGSAHVCDEQMEREY